MQKSLICSGKRILSNVKVEDGWAYSSDGTSFVKSSTNAPNGFYLAEGFNSSTRMESLEAGLRSKFSMDGFNEDRVPKAEHFLSNLDASRIVDASNFISDDDTRYFLMGVYIDLVEKKLVATNGKSMYLSDIEVDLPVQEQEIEIADTKVVQKGIIVKITKSLLTVLKMKGTKHIGANSKKFILKNEWEGQIDFVSVNLIDGMFPSYQRVIPTDNEINYKNYINIDEAMLDKASTLKKVQKDKNPIITFKGDKAYYNGKSIQEIEIADYIKRGDSEVTVNYSLEILKKFFSVGGNQIYLNSDNPDKRASKVYARHDAIIIGMPSQLD